MNALAKLLLTTDPRRRVRVMHSGLALALLAGGAVLMHDMAAAGLSDGRWLWPWTLGALGGATAILLFIRFGWSERLADPSMTLAQMLFAVACAATAYMLAGRGHGAVLLMLGLSMMFGVFGMSRRQVLLVGLTALAVLALVMTVMARQDPLAYAPAQQRVEYAMTALVIGGVMTVNWRLVGMRERLDAQRAELAGALARISELATRDALTGLFNRRHLQGLMEAQRERSLRAGHPWSVALIDVDHFKRVNDQYGHAAGDDVLRAIAETGAAMVRKGDVLARWGGEEFVLMMHDIEQGGALVAAQRLRARLANRPVRTHGVDVPVTVSMGVATHRVGEPVEQTLSRADAALYRAKSEGRNRVVVAE
jgi:diguanylate cyclase (GGDEF)-like protein